MACTPSSISAAAENMRAAEVVPTVQAKSSESVKSQFLAQEILTHW